MAANTALKVAPGTFTATAHLLWGNTFCGGVVLQRGRRLRKDSFVQMATHIFWGRAMHSKRDNLGGGQAFYFPEEGTVAAPARRKGFGLDGGRCCQLAASGTSCYQLVRQTPDTRPDS